MSVDKVQRALAGCRNHSSVTFLRSHAAHKTERSYTSHMCAIIMKKRRESGPKFRQNSLIFDCSCCKNKTLAVFDRAWSCLIFLTFIYPVSVRPPTDKSKEGKEVQVRLLVRVESLLSCQLCVLDSANPKTSHPNIYNGSEKRDIHNKTQKEKKYQMN